MPKSLYPRGSQRSRTMSQNLIFEGPVAHVKEPLLCEECECRFSRNGETPVIPWLGPRRKEFPLGDRLRVAMPIFEDSKIAQYRADAIGVKAENFAYFAVSMVWRGVAHRWKLTDGSLTNPMTFGECADLIRDYLLGNSPFPKGIMSVIVLVCSDSYSRAVWSLPEQHQEAGCENYRFMVRGVLFRVLVGKHIPDSLKNASCMGSQQSIFYGNAAHRVSVDFCGALRVVTTELTSISLSTSRGVYSLARLAV